MCMCVCSCTFVCVHARVWCVCVCLHVLLHAWVCVCPLGNRRYAHLSAACKEDTTLSPGTTLLSSHPFSHSKTSQTPLAVQLVSYLAKQLISTVTGDTASPSPCPQYTVDTILFSLILTRTPNGQLAITVLPAYPSAELTSPTNQ